MWKTFPSWKQDYESQHTGAILSAFILKADVEIRTYRPTALHVMYRVHADLLFRNELNATITMLVRDRNSYLMLLDLCKMRRLFGTRPSCSSYTLNLAMALHRHTVCKFLKTCPQVEP